MNMSVAKPQATMPQTPVEQVFTRISPAPQDAGKGQASQAPENNIKVLQEIQKEKNTLQEGVSEEVRELAEEMNEIMDDLQTSLGFSIHENIPNQVVVEIKNRETGDLIRQIPAEQLISIKEKMDEFTGILFDQSV